MCVRAYYTHHLSPLEAELRAVLSGEVIEGDVAGTGAWDAPGGCLLFILWRPKIKT